jgi:hypothetical protein
MKDIYELLNELNIESSDVEEMEVSEIERERGKRKLMSSLKKRSNHKKKICVAAAVFLAIISTTSIIVENPTWAENIPIIGDLVQKSLVDVNKQYADYINTVGQTKSHEGIDVTFENAVADNNMFTYSFVVKNNNNPIGDPELLADLTMFIKINDKDINMSGTSQCEVVDKNTIKYLRTVNLDGKDLPKYLNVKIDIPEAFNKKGNWGVEFSMNTKDIKKDTFVEKLNNKFNIDNIDFGLDEISISPLSTNIKYYANSTEDNLNMMFLVLDQDNNEIKFANGESRGQNCTNGEAGKIRFSMNYINNGNVSSLKLIPRYRNKDYTPKKIESKKINLDNFAPFEVKLTDNMSININNLTVDNGYLIVKYNYKYLGKNMEESAGVKDLDIKANGTSLAETDDDFAEKYKSKDEKINMYKIDNTKDIEMDFYDRVVQELHENEAITILKK